MLDYQRMLERQITKGNITQEQVDQKAAAVATEKEKTVTVGSLKELVTLLKSKGVI